VDLSWNSITSIGASAVSGATRLDSLIIASNALTLIHQDAFANATRLRQLYIWRNRGVGPLPSGLFEGVRGLTAVEGFMSGFQSLPPTQLSNLDYLKLASFSGSAPLLSLPPPLAALGNPLLRVAITPPAGVAHGCAAAPYDVVMVSDESWASGASPPPLVRLPGKHSLVCATSPLQSVERSLTQARLLAMNRFTEQVFALISSLIQSNPAC
jgi:hypothetical protein